MISSSVRGGLCLAFWMVFAFLICYYSSVVSPYYEIPTSYDPVIYDLMGRGMMEGLVPYRDLFDQKGPLIFFIYGVSRALCGSCWLVALLEVFASVASMAFCYKTARLFVSERKAFVVSLLVVYSLCGFHCYAGGGHPAEFVLPFQLAAAYEVCRLYRNPVCFIRTGIVFGAGIGMALLLKFNLASFWFVPCLYVLARARTAGKAWLFAGALCGTVLLMLLPCFWYFYSHGALRDLYEGYVVFNAGYGASAESFKDICRNYARWVERDIMHPNMMLMYAAGVLGVVLSRLPVREKVCYAASFLVTCVGVQGNGQMHCNHYGQTLIPFALAGYLLAARMVHVGDAFSRNGRRCFFPALVLVLVAYTYLNCVDFSAGARARERKTSLILPDAGKYVGAEESCAAIGQYAVWFYEANGLLPPIRTFIICASGEKGAERERMRQYREILHGKIEWIVVAGEFFYPDRNEYPSQKGMRHLLDTEYCLERSFPRRGTVLDVYRRVKKD